MSPKELTFGLRLSALGGAVLDAFHEHNGGADALAVAGRAPCGSDGLADTSSLIRGQPPIEFVTGFQHSQHSHRAFLLQLPPQGQEQQI